MKHKKAAAICMTLLMTATPSATVFALPSTGGSSSADIREDSVDSSEFDAETLPDFETEETAVGGGKTIDDETPDSQGEIAVRGKYQTYAEAAEVISVDLSWDSMNFTYAETQQGTWNPLDHSYDNANVSGWVNNSAEIRVVNHSNTALAACMNFDAADGSTATGSFSSSVLSLKNAETASLGDPDSAPSGSTTFTVGGTINRAQTLGTITVKLKDAELVTDVDVLQDALKNGGVVTLIGTTKVSTELYALNDVVLNLNNQTLMFNRALVNSNTEMIVTGPGTLECPSEKTSHLFDNSDTLVIENCNVQTYSASILGQTSYNATTTIRGGTFTITSEDKCSDNYQFSVSYGTLNIQDGTFASGSIGIINIGENGNAVISGGTFTTSKGSIISGQNITISGGKFTAGTSGKIFGTSCSNITITGGSFDQDPSRYVEEGYEAVYSDATGYYEVMSETD